MTTKNLETLKNSEMSEIQEQMDMLKKEVWWDPEKFKKLLNDPETKKWLDKIFLKCFKDAWYWETIRSVETKYKNVWENLTKLLSAHPKLWFYVSQTLNLPISREVKFSDLTVEQKINYTLLITSLTPWQEWKTRRKRDVFETVTDKVVADEINSEIKNAYNRINDKFKSRNWSNFLFLEKTLKSEFWLTETETKKVVDYLKMIKEHPEFIWKPQYNKAWWWKGIIFVLWVVLWAMWMYGIMNIWKPNPDRNYTTWKTEIGDPEDILRILTQKIPFETSGQSETAFYTKEEDDNLLVSIGKDAVNFFETKTLNMEMSWELWLQYNMHDNSKMTIDHATGEVIIEVAEPDVIILNYESHIRKRRNEVIPHSAFNDEELKLEKQLQWQAIDELKSDHNKIDSMERATEQELLKLFQALKPYNVDIKSVKIVHPLTRNDRRG